MRDALGELPSAVVREDGGDKFIARHRKLAAAPVERLFTKSQPNRHPYLSSVLVYPTPPLLLLCLRTDALLDAARRSTPT